MESPANLTKNKNVILSCLICGNLFTEPVTIRCGHSFCRNCILRNKKCKNCGTVDKASQLQCNVLLTTVIEKWFRSEYRAARLKTEANVVSENQKLLYSRANKLDVGSSQMKENPAVDPNLLSKEDFKCSLCYRLLYQPVTTPCGHTFCRQCLYRYLDYHNDCTLCKGSLVEYLAERRQALTQSVEGILENYFPEAYAERRKKYEEEMVELASMGVDEQHAIPISVCVLALPKLHYSLSVFEPWYRLMIRQCLESGTRQFGMCLRIGETEDFYSEYGCMLEIRKVHYFPDGRSNIDCIGGRRFRVLSRGRRDGYNTAKVKFFTDSPVQESEIKEMKGLLNKVYDTCEKWMNSVPFLEKWQNISTFGDFPGREPDELTSPNGPAWLWWMIQFFVLDPKIKLEVLAMSTLKERLLRLDKIFTF